MAKTFQTSKFTIEVDFSLPQVRAAYKHYFGEKDNPRPTKKDLAHWLGALVSADVQTMLPGTEDEDDE